MHVVISAYVLYRSAYASYPVLLTSKMKVDANSAAASLINVGKRKRTAMAKSQLFLCNAEIQQSVTFEMLVYHAWLATN